MCEPVAGVFTERTEHRELQLGQGGPRVSVEHLHEPLDPEELPLAVGRPKNID